MADVENKKEEPVATVEDNVEEAKDENPKSAEENDGHEEVEGANTNANGDSQDEPSELESKIIRQVEYYFGDANLNRDKFLLEQISKDEGGWVPFSVLLTFKRLASLSDDREVIVNALAKSDEGLIEISEDKLKLRRHPERPLPEHNEERRKEIMSRTAYAKGFPLDIDMSELIEFFNPYVRVLNINMRKYLDKPSKTYKFKGSVFVTFEKIDQAREFIEKEKVVYKERELLRKWQEVYLEEKKEEMKARSKKKAKTVKGEEEKLQLPKGTVLHFTGASDVVTRELLRAAIEKIEGDLDVAYIEYSKGEKEGHIRFAQENSATKFLEKLENNKLKLSVDDIELTLSTLTEDEEKVFLEKAVEYMKNRRNQQNKHKGGHHYGNRKRRGGNENRNDAKKKKTAATN